MGSTEGGLQLGAEVGFGSRSERRPVGISTVRQTFSGGKGDVLVSALVHK